MWTGMRAIQIKGTVILHFDGASRGNPEGPAGYGFRITVGDDENELVRSLVNPFSHGIELIRGYGYGGMDRTTNEMENRGLLDDFDMGVAIGS
jgi:ribonuclease HI